MYLARIDDSGENGFVVSRVGTNAWIGANDQGSEGVWRWSNNNDQFWQGAASGSPVGGRYSNWNSGEPNDSSGEDCAEFQTSGGWNDLDCAEARVYMCEGS
jgi:hypothetical protein